MKNDNLTRRLLMTGIGASVPALALAPSVARAQSPSGFTPARHDLDAWMDAVPGQHRVFIDSSTPAGGAEAVLYANNIFRANENAYSIPASDLAVVVCFRHFSTIFAYNDAIWAKYGAHLGGAVGFNDPNTGEPPTSNLMDSADYGMALPNFGNTITQQIARGAQFAVCQAATNFFAGIIAEATGGAREEIFEELVANAIPNSHFMSAGVIATTRAQEYGYSLLYAG